MYRKGYDYKHEMVNIAFSHDVSLMTATAEFLQATEEDPKVGNDNFNLIILDCRNGHDTVYILHKTSGHPWTTGYQASISSGVGTEPILIRSSSLRSTKFATLPLLW